MTTTIQSATISAQPASGPIERPAARGGRLAGAIVAATIGLVATALGMAAGAAIALLPGLPAATFAGFLLAPSVTTDRRPVAATLAMATLTVAIADAVVVAWLVASARANGGDVLAGAITLWLFGLLFVGLPALILALPCAAIWAYGVRKLAAQSVVA